MKVRPLDIAVVSDAENSFFEKIAVSVSIKALECQQQKLVVIGEKTGCTVDMGRSEALLPFVTLIAT
jgi:hypothetical protein